MLFIIILIDLYKLFTLHKHTAGTAAWVKNTPFIRLKHLNQQLYNASRSVELSSLFAFCQCKFTKEVFKYPAQEVFTSGFPGTQFRAADKVNQTAKALFV